MFGSWEISSNSYQNATFKQKMMMRHDQIMSIGLKESNKCQSYA